MINTSEIMRTQLARSLWLDKYAEIMRGDPASPSFQWAFNGYYVIVGKDETMVFMLIGGTEMKP